MNWLSYSHDQFILADPSDKRILNFIDSSSSSKMEIWGYPDDEGIWMNKGRPGARLAPDKIREFLYKMTPHHPHWGSLRDFGNLSVKNPLKVRHDLALERARTATKAHHSWMSFGGGHDYGYSDAAGFLEGTAQGVVSDLKQKSKPVILNFDAHLDVRPNVAGDNSGTPFYRLLSREDLNFHFFEIGIQDQCNSPAHRKWALERGAKILDLALIRRKGLKASLEESLSQIERQSPLFLSLDMDCFSSIYAPGCSQSWSTGLQVEEFLETFEWLSREFYFQGLGIYEVSPPLDLQHQTSKLAALIAYHFLRLKNGD